MLDEDGYLTQPLEEIVALFSAEAQVDLEELGIALKHLQNLEPAGVGARSPAECLLLQLRLFLSIFLVRTKIRIHHRGFRIQ